MECADILMKKDTTLCPYCNQTALLIIKTYDVGIEMWLENYKDEINNKKGKIKDMINQDLTGYDGKDSLIK
jgi:hypothetical protein